MVIPPVGATSGHTGQAGSTRAVNSTRRCRLATLIENLRSSETCAYLHAHLTWLLFAEPSEGLSLLQRCHMATDFRCVPTGPPPSPCSSLRGSSVHCIPNEPTPYIQRGMVHTTSHLLRFSSPAGVLKGTRACGP